MLFWLKRLEGRKGICSKSAQNDERSPSHCTKAKYRAEPGAGDPPPPKSELPEATIRFLPYQDPPKTLKPSLLFTAVTRTLPPGSYVIPVGRYSERDGIPINNPTKPSDAHVGFKSKVVSRQHCEFLYINGQWHIKDVGSSSGTFLNHVRLSEQDVVSSQYSIKDGDIVRLGVNLRGKEDMVFRCVRIRIECSRSWQQHPDDQSVIPESQTLPEQQHQEFISASSPHISPQLTLQPENSKVADLRRSSEIEPGSDFLDSFQSRLHQLQDTINTQIPRWIHEARLSQEQEIAHHEAPLSHPDFSIKETTLKDRLERKQNASQDASLITKPNFDEQATSPARPVENHEHPVITTTTSPSASTSTTNISSVVVQCLKGLSRLVFEDLSSFASEVPPALWKDELGRLRVWAANIGAHQTGQSSLDHRLRDASHIKEQTLRVLQRLQRTTEDINDILHHSPGDDDFSDLSGDEDDDEHQTEMQSIYHALRDTINNLFQMSMLIRQPAQHDRLLGTKRSDAVSYEQFDQRYVSDKYPQAGEDISKRLGLAISQRRAVMQYHGQSAKLSDTIATEFVEVSPAANDNLELLTVASQTSYAQTILNGAEGAVLPSPPKDSANRAPFECPYCFIIITIANRRAWARHVFNDLMPYLCVFPNCPTPHRLYESRREWFSHLQSQHSISETPDVHVDCPLCLSSLPSGKQLERHVGRHLEELALFALPRSEEDDDEAAISSDEDSDKSHDPVDEGRCPQCDLVFTNLRTHAMTHTETERPEKCPIVTCDYHTKGFARKYDKNRHVLTHYKGVMVCHFCPDAGIPKEKSFTRVDVFKRHLVSVHGAELMPPNQRHPRPISSIEGGINQTSSSTGNCSICSETFRDAQDFFNHLDSCVMLKVTQGSSESVNNMRLPGVSEDEETVDGRRHSSSSFGSQNEEKPYPHKGKTRVPRHLAHIPTIIDLGYPFKEEEDVIVIQRLLSRTQIDEVLSLSRGFKQPSPVGDTQSAKENELPDDISTEMLALY
ncbi:Zinc finger C2H2 [Penicillium cf. viridicatum]|uniref:Zinc finger C2H2 n=1 Tax=Penicillium cf. viridicatum TaxID=2972119 RepID=A0A9W9MV23_9EURO|nr:Zinc finger C2H2 [Penicillium cf. viridicatum]